MADLLLRNIDPGLKQRLAERARRNRRSQSAEALAILDERLQPGPHKGLGTELVELFRGIGGDDLELEYDQEPGPAPDFR